MTTQPTRLRSEFLNTQVITSDAGKRLGVVKELLVDIDRREVVALGLRDNLFSVAGMPRYMFLSEIRKASDVVLVENEDVIEDIDVDALSRLINSEVITETGERLGKVRDFQFNIEDGKVSSLIIASLGLPQIPDQVISTYELSVEEIASAGPDRIIVFEGAEERLTQLTEGILERLGISRPAWERDQEELYYNPPTARPENQLPTGIPERPPVAKPLERPLERPEPVYEEAWTEEDAWEPEPLPRRQQEMVRYEEYEEEDNWSEPPAARYEERYEETVYRPEPVESYEDHDIEEDVWEDKRESEPYEPPRIDIPEKTKAPEYEEETNY